jgi:hypothetical protein
MLFRVTPSGSSVQEPSLGEHMAQCATRLPAGSATDLAELLYVVGSHTVGWMC